MYKLCVFGGTTEGRELVEFLNTQPCRVTACVATEYGQTLLPEGENLTVSARPLPVGEIGALLQAERFDLVIDATHPYAASITRSIAAACEAAGVEHWRLLRGASEAPEDAVFAENTDEAVRFLSGTEGNILLTTGSKELSKFAALPDFAARCWARVLPLPASLEACGAAGLSPSHIFALQGPFSREMDEAMLHRTGARWLVTKDGGAAGGFQEKAAAARHAGARLLVIGRPTQETGSSLPETIGALCARFGKDLPCPTHFVHLPALPVVNAKFKAFDEARFQKDWEIQVHSAVKLCKAVLPAMSKAKFGRVLFIQTSYTIGCPPKNTAAYVMNKSAIGGLVKSLAVEYARFGITVNCVAPSMMETHFLKDTPDLIVQAAAADNPMSRNATPEDVAPAMAFLLSEEARFITGITLPVTGGSAIV